MPDTCISGSMHLYVLALHIVRALCWEGLQGLYGALQRIAWALNGVRRQQRLSRMPEHFHASAQVCLTPGRVESYLDIIGYCYILIITIGAWFLHDEIKALLTFTHR